jgi:hypothetical protein
MSIPTSIKVAADHTGVNFDLSMNGSIQRFFLRRDAIPVAVDAPPYDNATLKAIFLANDDLIRDAAQRKARTPGKDVVVLSATDFAVALRY